MSPPLVSVCMATYNHERFVGAAIRSVLDQTFGDWELIVVNDGSTDATAERIAEFTDPRIIVIHQNNQGPAAATNRALAATSGRYVALFSGDDVCHPTRLEKQLAEYQRGGRRILFAGVDFIGDEGQALPGDHFAKAYFDTEPLTRAQTLARLFLRGNFLNGVTVFTEREVFGNAPYDPTLLQLQDFDLWARLVARCDVCVMPEPLVSYRIRGGGANLSAPGAEGLMRVANEHYLVLRRFFDGVSDGLFYEAFADSILRPECRDAAHRAIEQAFLFTRSPWPFGKLIGVERLHEMLNDPATAAVLARDYSFTPVQFFASLGSVDATNLFGNQISTLFYDTGASFSPRQEIRRSASYDCRQFHLKFLLPAASGLRGLRWDPVEGRACRVRLDRITERYADGRIRELTVDDVASNGQPLTDGSVDFETADPSFWWSCDEGVVDVSLHGEWSFDNLVETVQELRRQNAALRQTLNGRPPVAGTIAPPSGIARRILNRLKAS